MKYLDVAVFLDVTHHNTEISEECLDAMFQNESADSFELLGPFNRITGITSQETVKCLIHRCDYLKSRNKHDFVKCIMTHNVPLLCSSAVLLKLHINVYVCLYNVWFLKKFLSSCC